MSQFNLRLGETVPNFDCKTTQGNFKFHEFVKSDVQSKPYTVLMSHPSDYTPVCTTELGRAETLCEAFANRGAKLIGLSCDSVEQHGEWSKDILHREKKSGSCLSFPVIADESREIVSTMGMLDPRTAMGAKQQALPARALIVFDSDCKVRLAILYPASTGRSFDEVLRVLDSLRVADKFHVATPADWKAGQPVLVPSDVSTEEANAKLKNVHTEQLPSGKEYLRFADVRE